MRSASASVLFQANGYLLAVVSARKSSLEAKMSLVQQEAPTLLLPGVQTSSAEAVSEPAPAGCTVEPTWKVKFARSGESAHAGEAGSAASRPAARSATISRD